MKQKHHKIKTIQGILNVVNDSNIDDFILDFTKFLVTSIHIKQMYPDHNSIFTWIDDKKHKIIIGCKK